MLLNTFIYLLTACRYAVVCHSVGHASATVLLCL